MITPRRALIVDTETTGLDPSVDKCIEVACILYDLKYAAPVAAFSELIWSETNAGESVNHIPTGLVQDESLCTTEGVWIRVSQLLSRADVILAHRAEFDRSFFPEELRTRKPWVCTKFHVQWPQGAIGDDLIHLALKHGVGVVHAHRALTDCDIISRLLSRVAVDSHSLVELITKAMRPRVKVVALVSYNNRETAKAAGFGWDAEKRRWWREIPEEDIATLPFKVRRL